MRGHAMIGGVSESPAARSNLWPLAGASLGLFGLGSYFALFARYPALRDSAALNLLLVLAGLVVAGRGLDLALRRGGALRLAGASLAMIVAAGCAALLGLYVLGLSKGLPAPSEQTLALERAPDFTLSADDGSPVSLAALRGRRVLLVFYRGAW
jgi:hypothetical protein